MREGAAVMVLQKDFSWDSDNIQICQDYLRSQISTNLLSVCSGSDLYENKPLLCGDPGISCNESHPFPSVFKYFQCLWSISGTFYQDYGSENTRNRQISFRRIPAVVHFFIWVVFLAKVENFEIMKSKKNVTKWRQGTNFKIKVITCRALEPGSHLVEGVPSKQFCHDIA